MKKGEERRRRSKGSVRLGIQGAQSGENKRERDCVVLSVRKADEKAASCLRFEQGEANALLGNGRAALFVAGDITGASILNVCVDDVLFYLNG